MLGEQRAHLGVAVVLVSLAQDWLRPEPGC